MASAGPIHLTAEEVCQSVCYSSRFMKIVVVVGEVRRSSSFYKHTTSM